MEDTPSQRWGERGPTAQWWIWPQAEESHRIWGTGGRGPGQVSSQVIGMKGAPAYKFLSSGLALSLSTCHILFILFTF